jgi:cytochrome c peroxidase
MKRLIALTIFSILSLSAGYYGFLGSNYPEYFPSPATSSAAPVKKEVVRLGRMLFYDPVLSKDNSISCASCHSPFSAFSHNDHDLSHGIYDRIGTRNAPALFNLAWQTSFMWDGSVNHLEMQAMSPIVNEREMAEEPGHVVCKLQRSNLYRQKFAEAFGDTVVTSQKLFRALSQFQLTLVSADSKYDRVRQHKEEFTAQEQSGYALFKKHCNSCHNEPLFSSNRFASNGLPFDSSLKDYGRWRISGLRTDSMLFRIPSLRNLSFTFPYMHDGRFKKLYQVLTYYSSIDINNPSLSSELRRPIKLSSNEKVDLIAFLLALDDRNFILNKEHHYPKDLFLQGGGEDKN